MCFLLSALDEVILRTKYQLIAVELVLAYVHTELQAFTFHEFFQFCKRLLTEVAELQQIVFVE
jgi:hypothetical protein